MGRSSVRLEIGGGELANDGWLNLDPIHGDDQIGMRRRLQDGIPLPDESVDEARASHVMEHIPAGEVRIRCMNEVWRVMKRRGLFTVVVPLFPSWQAVADPTHVSFWARESFDYFVGAIEPNADYGIRTWELVDFWTVEKWEGWAVLAK